MSLPGSLSASLFQLVTVVQAPGLCEIGVGDAVGAEQTDRQQQPKSVVEAHSCTG